MKLDPKYKLEKAASKDQSRPVLSCAYLDVDAGAMVATDSYCLAVVPVETGLDDVSGLVPGAALVATRKLSTRYVQAEATANGSVEVKGPESSATFERPQGTFPDWQRLIDRPADEAPEVEPIAEFGVNAAILARLAEAIGAGNEGVRIRVYDARKPLRVDAIGSDGYGLCMPILLRS